MPQNEQIRFDIIFNTRAALDQLAAMSESAANFEQRITGFSNYLIQNSKKWGIPLKELKQDFLDLDAEMKSLGEKGGLPEGIFPGQDIAEISALTDQYMAASQAANGFRVNQQGVVTSIGQVIPPVQRLSAEIAKLQKPARNNLGQFAGGTDFANQLKSVDSYAGKLQVVQNTIQKLATTTGSSFTDAGAALQKAFPELLKDTNLTTVAVENLTKANAGLSASFRTEAETMQLVNKALTEQQAAGKLNLVGNNNAQIQQLKEVIRNVSKETGAQYQEVGKGLRDIGVPAEQVRVATKGLNTELSNGTREAQGFSHSIDVVRTALGTLTAVGVFGVISAISQAFSDAKKNAQELEDSMYRLSNAERILSSQGTDISVKGLEEGIKRIKSLMPIFSKEDIAGLVGQISITTQNLGLTEKQILDLSQAITVLNVNSAESETLQTTAQHVISSLITDNAKGVANLGLDMSKANVEAKALQMNLIAPGESIDSLSEYEKNMVKVQIAIDTAGNSMGGLNDYMSTNTAKIQENTAAWQDALTTWGSIITYLTPITTALSKMLDAAGKMIKTFIILGQIATANFKKILEVGPIDAWTQRLETAGEVAKKAMKNLFPEGNPFGENSKLGSWLHDLYAQTEKETPTSPFAGLDQKAKEDGQKLIQATQETETKVTEIMQEARDKRAQIEEDYRRKIQDANTDYQRKLEDISLDVARKQEDAQRNYGQKIEDINRDANEKIAAAQDDARQKEIDREKQFQEKLRELREKFLFDLEDALRERDARQVLRLIRQYQMDKKSLEEKRKLDAVNAKKDLAQKLADIEQERQLKLQAAARELAEKNAEIQRWAERERADAQLALQRKLADARIWHQRELQEYQQYLQQKLKALADSIMKEYKLTAAGAESIYKLITSYFGATGSISQALASGLTASLTKTLSSTSGMSGGSGLADPSWARQGFYGAAEGGTFVATRPTKVVFGEKGPEVASFTPLGRTGADVGKIVNGADMKNQNNSVTLRIGLSDGLTADIVDASLDSVAAIIQKIGREK